MPDRVLERLAELADHLDASDRGDPVVRACALTKMGASVMAAPFIGAFIGASSVRRTRRMRQGIASFPRLIADVAAGRLPDLAPTRIIRLPAAGRYLITSDLHRSTPGPGDWPTIQQVTGLYAEMLDSYGEREWTLVENGDVEDFWVVGGSVWGCVYDAARIVQRLGGGSELWSEMVRCHLDRIVSHNEAVYERIERHFSDRGRYFRTVGNHDDVYLHDEGVAQLRRHHPGVGVADFVVLEAAPGPQAVITHGHQTDSWNAPFQDGLGKLMTWMGSLSNDLPFGPSNPDLPSPAVTARMLDGTWPDLLTPVSHLYGANGEFDSTNEVQMHKAWLKRWGGDTDEPWLFLGHTHHPLRSPGRPDDSGSRWSKYLNSGSGITHRLITAIEWDGTGDPLRPRLRLVAWHRDGDGATQRFRLEADGDRLRPVPLGREGVA